MQALALLLSLGWFCYLFLVDVRLHLHMEAALVAVPAGMAKVLKALTLLAVFLLPAMGVYFALLRVGEALDGPSPEQMLEAVRRGHGLAMAKGHAIVDQALAGLSEKEAAELRPLMEGVLQRAAEDAARREALYAANPAQMQKDVRDAIAEIRAKQPPG